MTNVDRTQVAFFGYMTAGVFGLLALFSLTAEGGIGVTDGYFNAALAVLFVVAAQLLGRGKLLGAILIGLGLLTSIGFDLWIGRGLNFIMVIFGVAWAVWLMALRSKGQLNG